MVKSFAKHHRKSHRQVPLVVAMEIPHACAVRSIHDRVRQRNSVGEWVFASPTSCVLVPIMLVERAHSHTPQHQQEQERAIGQT
jgi:hypothetical protein